MIRKREYYYEGGVLFLKCRRCQEMQPKDNFFNDKTKKFGVGSTCKKCSNEIHREKRESVEYREKEKVYRHMYNITHRKEQRECRRKYLQAHPETTKKDYEKNKKMYKKNAAARIGEKSDEVGYNIKKFHAKANTYSKSRGLNLMCCTICGKEGAIDMHHPSYDNFEKRKDVVFLCRSCHKLVHTGELECPEPVDLIQLDAHMPTILTDKDLEYANS